MGINQVEYVENKRSESLWFRWVGGVIIIKTAVSASKSELINSQKIFGELQKKRKSKLCEKLF